MAVGASATINNNPRARCVDHARPVVVVRKRTGGGVDDVCLCVRARDDYRDTRARVKVDNTSASWTTAPRLLRTDVTSGWLFGETRRYVVERGRRPAARPRSSFWSRKSAISDGHDRWCAGLVVRRGVEISRARPRYCSCGERDPSVVTVVTGCGAAHRQGAARLSTPFRFSEQCCRDIIHTRSLPSRSTATQPPNYCPPTIAAVPPPLDSLAGGGTSPRTRSPFLFRSFFFGYYSPPFSGFSFFFYYYLSCTY